MNKTFRNDHHLVVFKKSKIHGTGGFARVDIRRGKRIIEYVGPKLTKDEAEAELQKFNYYIFTLDDQYDIDGSVDWNPARFINHGCDPNCEVDIVRGRIWIYARRNLKAGEELTYNYSHDLADYRERPCRCGSPKCVGYIVAEQYFDALRKKSSTGDLGAGKR
jgi:SET domain-containing protein